jgi:hypothetical protein
LKFTSTESSTRFTSSCSRVATQPTSSRSGKIRNFQVGGHTVTNAFTSLFMGLSSRAQRRICSCLFLFFPVRRSLANQPQRCHPERSAQRAVEGPAFIFCRCFRFAGDPELSRTSGDRRRREFRPAEADQPRMKCSPSRTSFVSGAASK